LRPKSIRIPRHVIILVVSEASEVPPDRMTRVAFVSAVADSSLHQFH
jgi:hypothetical protein